VQQSLLEVPGANGYDLVVKATRSANGLFVTSFRRISGDPAERAQAVRQLLKREIK